MVVLGVDAHKRTHTIVIIDERGRRIADRTINATTADHLALVTWAQAHGEERLWAVEDCRHLSRRLERDLLAAGERIVRVPTKMMAAARKSSRDYGKSDPIDALAVARAALQEPDLPVAHLDGPAREVRLLVDHREDLVAERTRIINRLRWHLHELDPTWDPPVRSFDRNKTIVQLTANLAGRPGTVARLARRLLVYCTNLTAEIKALDDEIAELIVEIAPTLLKTCGIGTLSAAKIVGETADVRRFKSKDAFAATPAPRPYQCGHQTIPAIASAEWGTANSTAPFTGWHSPKLTGSPTPGPTSNAAKPPETPRKRPYESSSADSPTSCIEP